MKWFLSVALVFVALVAYLWPHSSARVTVVLATSPVSVWSLDKKSDTFIVLEFPADYVTEGAHGYGKYSLESLWKLGFIDKQSGKLFTESIQDLIAINIPYYIGERSDVLINSDNVLAYGKKIFSIPMFFRRLKTNIPLLTYISFVYTLQHTRLDAVQIIDFSEKSVTNTIELPDGTKQQLVDSGKLDILLKGLFEDESIRQENLTVAVYNTTATPFIGTHAARMLTSIGILVVTVGNGEEKVNTCVIKGSEETMKTKTAQRVKQLFSCTSFATDQSERADLEVYLGTENAD